MILEVRAIGKKKVAVPFKFPFYRETVHDEDHVTYYKFYSKHHYVRVDDRVLKMEIEIMKDENLDFIAEEITEDLLLGHGHHSVINESIYDRAVERLIEKVVKA